MGRYFSNLGYDSDIKSENKVIGHVQISHGIGISLRLAKKDNALDTFRKGGNNLILETTEQEDSILDNNTPAQTVELSYSTGNFQFSIVVENPMYKLRALFAEEPTIC